MHGTNDADFAKALSEAIRRLLDFHAFFNALKVCRRDPVHMIGKAA
jgi:hypothetical protein